MMQKLVYFLTVFLVVTAAAVVFAGGGSECQHGKAAEASQVALAGHSAKAGHRCTESAEACLNAKAAAYAQRGYLGIETDQNADGYWAVATVVPGSPAEKAGFRAGDVLVALNGVAITEENKAALKEAKQALAVGKQVTYTVKRGGAKQTLTATLAPVPREVLARWVGEHMLEHHVEVTLAQAN